MIYLDYAKETSNGYILNFFADKEADLADISNGKRFVTKNGINYGVPQPSSTVVITMPDKTRKTYILNKAGEWQEGGADIGGNKFAELVQRTIKAVTEDDLQGSTSIGNSAFRDCRGLTSVTIPDSVTSIAGSAFNGCSGLTSITMLSTTPPTLGWSAIPSNVTTITVPAGCSNTYKTADGWSDYADKIVEATA